MSDELDDLTPEDAFALLGNETRIAILRTLWESPHEPVPFSELRERAGVRDSGQFNYHLGKLTDRFIRKGEDGYQLRLAGWYVLGAILSGVYTQSPTLDPIETDDPCPICGGTVQARYADERMTVECVDCDERFASGGLPPGILTAYERADYPYVFDRWIASVGTWARNGICVSCLGRMDPHLEVREGEPTASFVCRRCPERYESSPGAALRDDPRLVAFHADHGIDLRSEPSWRIGWLHEDHADIVSEDPLRVRVTARLGDDTLELTVDDHLAVIDGE